MILLCIIFNMETIVRLLQSIFIGKKNEWPATEARQHYQDELLEKILAYIDETIHDSHYQSPKKYINELKLETSRQMICEGKYTISEITLMLGFNSIHYFSRAFTQKYGMAPGEYSKTLYKL